MNQVGIEGNLLVGYAEGRYIRSFSHYEHYLLKQKLGASFDIYPVLFLSTVWDKNPFHLLQVFEILLADSVFPLWVLEDTLEDILQNDFDINLMSDILVRFNSHETLLSNINYDEEEKLIEEKNYSKIKQILSGMNLSGGKIWVILN